MNKCSNFQNYFDYISECLEQFQITEKTQSSLVTTTTKKPTTTVTSTTSTPVTVASTTVATSSIVTDSASMAPVVVPVAEPVTSSLDTTPVTTEITTSVTTPDASTETTVSFSDVSIVFDDTEGSSELLVTEIVKSSSAGGVQKSEFNYWPAVLITAFGWIVIGLLVLIVYRRKRRYKIEHPEIEMDYIPYKRRVSKMTRTDRDRIVKEAVISPGDDPVSIV